MSVKVNTQFGYWPSGYSSPAADTGPLPNQGNRHHEFPSGNLFNFNRVSAVRREDGGRLAGRRSLRCGGASHLLKSREVRRLCWSLFLLVQAKAPRTPCAGDASRSVVLERGNGTCMQVSRPGRMSSFSGKAWSCTAFPPLLPCAQGAREDPRRSRSFFPDQFASWDDGQIPSGN